MTRYNFHLPEPLMEVLKAQSKREGVTVAEIVRRVLMEYVKK
jgi:predicted DNA-binding protein